MNNYSLLLAIACCLAVPSRAVAESTPPLPPKVAAAVRAELEEGLKPHRDVRVPAPRSIARPVDLNGDGVTDWRVDYGGVRFAYWCGTGGCLRQLWLSHAGTYVLAFDAQALELDLRGDGSGVLDVELHGVYCQRTGSEECSRSFRWNAAERRLAEVPNRHGATLLAGPLFQPVRLTDAELPPSVRAAHASLGESCRARRGRYLEYDFPVASVPDLDGDGHPDWIVDSTLTECDVDDSADAGRPGAPLLRVFHSGGGRVREATPLATDSYDIDIATRPARLLPRATIDDDTL
jgi:hypothetical protein